jgi:hypothetical protein
MRHCELVHVAPNVQALPHAPQLFALNVVSTHALVAEQYVGAVLGHEGVQVPFGHEVLPPPEGGVQIVHDAPHAFVLLATHEPAAHAFCPDGHRHPPFVQCFPPPHANALPQPPQLLSSDC